ncbi:MAG: MarR family transcriptional regulator [Pseudomonadota bacterium]
MKKQTHTTQVERAKVAVSEEVPLPHLSDQIAVAAALDRALDGSALWVLLGLYRAFAVLDRDQADEVTGIGLSPLQFNMLTVLQRTGQPTTMGALAGMLVVKPTNLSGNINSLIERGLVNRELNAADQRSLLAVLTPAGREYLAEHLPGHWRRLERLMYGLSREKRIQLVSLLKELVLSIEDEQQRVRAAANSEKKSRAA